jgi:hypothetical protein
MVRTVITPKSTNINLSIPKEYVGKTIEVTCLALEELESKGSKATMAKFWNVISNKTAEILYQEVEQSRNEW